MRPIHNYYHENLLNFKYMLNKELLYVLTFEIVNIREVIKVIVIVTMAI